MSQQTINVGSAANDGTGDPLRTAFTKANANFSELYGGFYNWKPQYLHKTQRMLGRVATGSAAGKIVLCGDSSMEGGVVAKASAPPTRAMAEFIRRGLLSRCENAYGSASTPDARVSIGTGWSRFANGQTVFTTNATGTYNFTPSTSVKSFDVYYFENSAGSFTLQIDAESAVTVNTTNTGLLKKTIVTSGSAAGTHTLKVAWVSGTQSIVEIDAYDPAVNDLRVINLGLSGSASTDWNSANGYAPNKLAVAMAADLYAVKLGSNDWELGVSVSTFTTNMQALITSLKAVGDVVLISSHPTGGTASPATQQPYIDATLALAVSNNIPMIDLFYRYESYAVLNALGMMSDTLHPTAVTYDDYGRLFASRVLGA